MNVCHNNIRIFQAMTPVPLHELKSETCPRISAEDLLDLLDLLPESKIKGRSQNIKILAIDIRSNEEYPLHPEFFS